MDNTAASSGNNERLSFSSVNHDGRPNTPTATTTAPASTTATKTSSPTHMNGGGAAATANNNNNNNTNNMMGGGGIWGGGNTGGGGVIGSNTTSSPPLPAVRRPQTISPSIEQKLLLPSQLLTLTIHKDSNGYGMKVSGDNPVFVESVKAGGAAQKAGLIAGDMILKVNGTPVRNSKHTHVVQLIKSHVIVELTVQRSQKMPRPSSVGIGPSTPLPQRDMITAPQPVDNEKRRELEFSKIKTLQLMMEQERKNLENLKSNNTANGRQDRAKAEARVRKLQEQLRQVGGEDPPSHFLTPSIITPSPTQQHHHIATTPQPQQHSSPAFLSRFPRSLSSLSLGTRKKAEKEPASPSNNADLLSSTSPSVLQSPLMHLHSHQQSSLMANITPSKKKFSGSERNLKDDIPPPLPQRNLTRKPHSIDENSADWRRNTPVSDLDHSMAVSTPSPKGHHISQPPPPASQKASANSSISKVSSSGNQIVGSSSGGKKRSKTKTKALSDPKMSTQMFLQMEIEHGAGGGSGGDGTDCSMPPPLPPRQPGMMEENQNIANNNRMSSSMPCTGGAGGQLGGSGSFSSGCGRSQPNSVDTLLNYPLVATCTSVRDNIPASAAFPLSQRPNIVQQLQQHQQHLHHLQQQHQHQNLPPQHSGSSASNKTSALGQTPLQHMNHHFNKHRRVVSSPEHMQPRNEKHLDRHNKSSSGSYELLEKDNEETPPGTPPPPYLSSHNISHSQAGMHMDDTDHKFQDHAAAAALAVMANPTFPNQILAAQANTVQKEIISMEDEEISDQECIVDEHGPFNYLQRLLEQENLAHLAVFLNYVISNSDPAPILFYLITGLYKEGTVKDMRKWAYEIHSTFLVPCAPLLWFNVDESLAREVDAVLQKEYDKVEILRKVFWKSRKKAKERICDQLRDFQQKRTAGLGTMYGPSDQQLSDAKGDKNREQKIFEETLLPKLQQLVDDLDREAPIECAKKLALCSALSTVLHRVFVTRSNPGSPIDRVHHFVSREKSFKSRLMGKSRKMVVRGHPLVLRQYYEVTHCNHCQTIIWGVSPQGYHCTDCKLNIHRPCSKVLEESCPGPVPQKHADNKISKLMGKIRPTHNFIQNERRRTDEDAAMDDFFPSGGDRPHSTSVVRQPSDRRPDNINTSSISSSSGGGVGSSGASHELVTSQSLDVDPSGPDTEHDSKRADGSKSKSAPVSVNRSESYKERLSHKRNRNNRRKTSDPSLSKTNDEQSELGLSNANFTASSSSSLSSSSLESPSTSLEQVGGPGSHAHGSVAVGGPMHTAGVTIPTPRQWVDSEDETDFIEVDWSSNVATELLAILSDGEKKRQEIINEIYQTERNHVRTLRLLEGIFMRPLQETGVLPFDHLQLLFPPALLSLKDLHSSFEQKLKQRRMDHSHLVRKVGDLLVGMFEGQSGDELREYAAQFCARQQIALEALKEKRRKDENLQRLLTKAESHKACRRLQLKDLLPTVLQRLTKYPLLFESLSKITKRVSPDDSDEVDAIQRALDSSKRILVDVNQAVKIAEDAHKLQSIQRKLDKSSYDKEASEFRSLDLTQLKLVHDGPLTMKKNPGVQLHGLLFENMMVLLHKQDDKYSLKYFPNLGAGSNDGRGISPITHFDQQTLVRQSAVDKNTFFLIITKTSQMLELTAPSSSECKTWFKHISDAAEQYKPRSKNSHEIVEDPATSTLPHSNTKESLEGTPERTTSSISAANNNQSPDIAHGNAREEQGYANSSSIAANEKNKSQFTNNNNLENRKDGKYESNNNTNSVNDDGLPEYSNDGLRITREDSRRDSVYSNNSNNTRTLMHCPLLEPSEIQISISPAHTAEPVVTPTERLRRLDEGIRDQLSEKQKIVCDMFRVPVEHFTAIADIAGQPEAPKDPSDIVLAAFAQVQSLTEVLSEYTKITSEQEISAVSTSVCDQCHQRNSGFRSASPLQPNNNTATHTVIRSPPLPESSVDDDPILQEDDGYCQIDELRLPAVVPKSQTIIAEPLKRQSTINADSIPEETEHEVTKIADDERRQQNIKNSGGDSLSKGIKEDREDVEERGDGDVSTGHLQPENDGTSVGNMGEEESLDSENSNQSVEPHDTITQSTKNFDTVDKTILLTEISLTTTTDEEVRFFGNGDLCGTNRLSHVHSLEPVVPCRVISGLVTTLSSQISLLLPKLNERDTERDRLRRENQHLRELLNAMHERQRVEEEKETPKEQSTATTLTDNDAENFKQQKIARNDSVNTTSTSTSSPERD